MDFEASLEVHYFSSFFFLLAIISFLFLGKLIKFIKSLHPFLKTHNALSRTISIAIIMGCSRIISIPLQEFIEKHAGRQMEYNELDILHSFFVGKIIAITLIFIILYFSK